MSNRVDFCRGEETSLSVPAGRAVVLVDGVLCPFFEVKEIVRASSPDYGSAVLSYNPAVWPDGGQVAVERIETVAAMGKSVRIVMPYDGGFGRTQVDWWGVFAGQIEKIETTIGPDGEAVKITANDFAARLGRITVYGQRVSDTLSLASREAVFNRDNQPNASTVLSKHAGREHRVFAVDERQVRCWTVAEAIVYLLSEYVVAGHLGAPSVEQIEGLFAGRVAGEIDVDGMTLLDALEKCCDETGVRFRFEPCQEEVAPSERIVFYIDGAVRKAELDLQRQGEKLSVSRTNIGRLKSDRAYWPVTHRYVGRGDWKVYEATFDLIKAWDGSLEGQSQGEYSPSTGSDFQAVRDVYRRWCLNEAGDYTDSPYNQGAAFDFGSIFEGAEYVQRRRKFIKALSRDASGESLGYYLEVSYDDGSTWQEYADSFEVLDDECGVWLSDDTLSAEVWTAINAGTLKFRITASVESDERLCVVVADGPVNSSAEVVEHVIDLAGRFAYRKVSGKSIFHNGASGTDAVDDSVAMHGYVRSICETNRAVIEMIDIETPIIGLHYNCGDRVVCSPDSRDVLGVRRDSRSVFWIERAVVDFQEQCTKLKVIRRRG